MHRVLKQDINVNDLKIILLIYKYDIVFDKDYNWQTDFFKNYFGTFILDLEIIRLIFVWFFA